MLLILSHNNWVSLSVCTNFYLKKYTPMKHCTRTLTHTQQFDMWSFKWMENWRHFSLSVYHCLSLFPSDQILILISLLLPLLTLRIQKSVKERERARTRMNKRDYTHIKYINLISKSTEKNQRYVVAFAHSNDVNVRRSTTNTIQLYHAYYVYIKWSCTEKNVAALNSLFSYDKCMYQKQCVCL